MFAPNKSYAVIMQLKIFAEVKNSVLLYSLYTPVSISYSSQRTFSARTRGVGGETHGVKHHDGVFRGWPQIVLTVIGGRSVDECDVS